LTDHPAIASSDGASLPQGGLTCEWLADRIADLVVRTDPAGNILYASAAARALGYEPEELVGRNAAELLHPDDLEAYRLNMIALFTGQSGPGDLKRERRYRRKDGSWTCLEGNPTILTGPDGKPAELLTVLRDVTEQRALRDALAVQAQLASMAESVAGVGYWRLDVASEKVTWSEQVFRMFGLSSSDELALATVAGMVHPDEAAATADRRAQALRTGEGWKDVIFRVVLPGGAIRSLKSRGVCERAPGGAVTAIFGTMIDVTEDEAAHQAIVESEQRYRLLAENVTDMISMTAPDGRTLYVSPSVARVTGYSVDEVLPTQMRDYVHPDDQDGFLAAYIALYRGGCPPGHPIRYRIRHADGRWIWLESRPKLALAADGRTRNIIDVSRDVTEAVELRERLRRALAEAEQAAAVKTKFLANMSHEIRTPLTAILGFSDLLAERRDLDAAAGQQVAKIGGASRALLAIVNDILDFSKLEAGQVSIAPRPTAAVAAAREVLELFTLQARAKSIDLRFEAGAAIPGHLMTDPDRFRQILLNLVGNAVKFTHRGAVTLRLDYDPAAAVLAAEVSDTGPGIAAAQRQRLFQRFSQVDGSSTRTSGGTGLGLAISQGLALAMGGGITVRSRLGRGSTFRVALPAQPAAVGPDAGAAAPREVLVGVRALVVDDNANNRELARCILESAGVEVAEARDGGEAIRVARDLPFDLILMDLRMPVLDGRGALAAIRNAPGPNQDTPVLAFSADSVSDLGDVDGFQGWVSKPIDASTLVAAIAAAIGEGSALTSENAHAAAA